MKLDKVFKPLGASNHTNAERQENDFYATDPHAVTELLKVESFNKILEPACGMGHISNALRDAGYSVTSFDIVDYGNNVVRDFFSLNYWDGDIITNPPYANALEFVKHSLNIINNGSKVAMLLRIQFLESAKRGIFFKDFPPKRVWVFTNRVVCAKNADFGKYKSSAMCYAWFVWEKGFKGSPILGWVNG